MAEEFIICKQCRFVKPGDHFYTSNRGTCKECVKANVRANRAEKIDYYRSFDRKRANLPKRVAARAEYIKTEAGKAAHARACDGWADRHPKRRSASHALNNALRDGKVKRHPCWVCGEKAQAHHPDYSRPLDVVWLCPQHHKAAHRVAA